MLVITVEVAFEEDDISEMPDAMQRVLDEARSSAAARVVGSYHQPGAYGDSDNLEWRNRAVSEVVVPVPSRIRVD